MRPLANPVLYPARRQRVISDTRVKSHLKADMRKRNAEPRYSGRAHLSPAAQTLLRLPQACPEAPG